MRISNLHVKQNQLFNMAKSNQGSLKAQEQLITGKKFSTPSDAPLQSITSIYTRIRLNQLERYETNLAEAETRTNIAHEKITTANHTVRRVRELAVQAANGTLTRSDRHLIALEVEEMLQQLVSVGNSQYEDGYIFSGSKEQTLPFQTVSSFQNELGRTLISRVDYNGDDLTKDIRIGDHDKAQILTNGGEVFWADRQTLISRTDSRNFINPEDSQIRIDQYVVDLNAGDNLDIIIEKINSAVPTVTAFSQQLPSGEIGLGIEANFPHQIALEDLSGSTALRSLGLLKEGAPGNVPYDNIRENVISDNGSLFDRMILLRDALIDNRVKDIGGIHLGGIDRGLENLVKSQAKISALSTRLHTTQKDISTEQQAVIERRSAVEDTDIAEASIKFNEWNYLHRITLQTASRLLGPTLLDFL